MGGPTCTCTCMGIMHMYGHPMPAIRPEIIKVCHLFKIIGSGTIHR